jgi:hypothetical protein
VLEQPGMAEQARTTGQVTFAGDDVRRWVEHLRGEITAQLAEYEPSELPEGPWRARQEWRTVHFAGRELRLEVRFDSAAAEIYGAIGELVTAEKALAEGLRYWLLFRRDMTTRADRVLRALREADGNATTAELAAACAGDLDPSEVELTLARLVGLGHAINDGERVRLTRLGRFLQ